MKTRKRNLTTKPTYHSYPILTDAKKGLATDTDILRNIEAQFRYAERTKSKAYFMRFDLHFPQEGMAVSPDNRHFSTFMSRFMKTLSRQSLKPQYCAVREQSRREEGRHHYHVVMFLDGQKTQSTHNHLAAAERLWENELSLPPKEGGYGLVDHCNSLRKEDGLMPNGIRLDRNSYSDGDRRDWCFRWASYLAKENTKGSPDGCREYFASQLPPEYRPAKPKKSKSNDDGD